MYLLKVAYLGWHFHGSQIQPDVKTVEGELLRALSESGWLEKRIGFASRTDAGVSARGNVFAYLGRIGRLGRLNKKLENIWVLGFTEVGDDFRPRHADQRWYRYYLIGDYPEKTVLSLKRFEGKHPSEEVSRIKGKTTVIDKIEIRPFQFGYVLDFFAPFFFWGEIRKIVGTVIGKFAPAEPLILMDIRYNGVNWNIEKKWLKYIRDKWKEELAKSMVIKEMENIFNL